MHEEREPRAMRVGPLAAKRRASAAVAVKAPGKLAIARALPQPR